MKEKYVIHLKSRDTVEDFFMIKKVKNFTVVNMVQEVEMK